MKDVNHTNDDELRASFHHLRDHDRRNVPPFSILLERADARARSAPRRHALAPIWVAAAAGILLATGLVARRSADLDRSRLVIDSEPSAIAAISLSTWRSPTAGLLDLPGRDLVAPPSVLSSTLDGVIQAPVNRKGDSR